MNILCLPGSSRSTRPPWTTRTSCVHRQEQSELMMSRFEMKIRRFWITDNLHFYFRDMRTTPGITQVNPVKTSLAPSRSNKINQPAPLKVQSNKKTKGSFKGSSRFQLLKETKGIVDHQERWKFQVCSLKVPSSLFSVC